jgi:DNA-binding response OmpR family regulator
VSVSRIVVVEDNPADVLLLREALNQHGIVAALDLFTNGEDAEKAIAAMPEAPALFILDLNVPRVHGLELLRRIRSRPEIATALVAIVTSSKAPSDEAQSEELGADAYIVKPMGYTEFVTNVGVAIGQLLHRAKAAGCARVSSRPPSVRRH